MIKPLSQVNQHENKDVYKRLYTNILIFIAIITDVLNKRKRKKFGVSFSVFSYDFNFIADIYGKVYGLLN